MSGLIPATKTRMVKEFRTSGTWVNPGVKTVNLFMVGGGAYVSISGGANGGNVVKTMYDVSGLASCAVVIGAGGSSGSPEGGATSFDGVAVANGGYGTAYVNTATWASYPSGQDGFGGVGGGIGGPAVNGGRSMSNGAANTGAGGAQSNNGGSGYLRVEWEE